MVQVPTLDELARDPGLIRELPPHVLGDLAGRCAAIVASINAALVDRVVSVTDCDDDELLSAPDVAALIGRSLTWVKHNTEKLPQRVSLNGRPMWRRGDVRKWRSELRVYGKLRQAV